jgi:hypothetical protein
MFDDFDGTYFFIFFFNWNFLTYRDIIAPHYSAEWEVKMIIAYKLY